jgi:hypothetical protein
MLSSLVIAATFEANFGPGPCMQAEDIYLNGVLAGDGCHVCHIPERRLKP